jgi:hypothetical protein
MPIVGQFGSLAGFGVFPGGALESIATVTVGSGGAANIEFASIPGGFQHLQIRVVARSTHNSGTAGAGNYMNVQFNSDTGSNYSYHNLSGNGASASAAGLSSQTAIYFQRIAHASESTSVFGVGIIDILDYAAASKNRTVRMLGGVDNNGGGRVDLTSGAWLSTNAITSVKLTPQTADFAQYTTAALYGVRA